MGAGESAYEEEEAEEVDEQTFLARATLFERLCDFYDEFNPEMFEAWGECSPAYPLAGWSFRRWQRCTGMRSYWLTRRLAHSRLPSPYTCLLARPLHSHATAGNNRECDAPRASCLVLPRCSPLPAHRLRPAHLLIPRTTTRAYTHGFTRACALARSPT